MGYLVTGRTHRTFRERITTTMSELRDRFEDLSARVEAIWRRL